MQMPSVLKRNVAIMFVALSSFSMSSCQEAGLLDGLLLGVWQLEAVQYVGVLPPASVPLDISYVFTEEPAQLVITTLFNPSLPLSKTVETATFVSNDEAVPKTLDVLVVESCTTFNGSETCIPIIGGVLNRLYLYELSEDGEVLTLYGLFEDSELRPASIADAEVIVSLSRFAE